MLKWTSKFDSVSLERGKDIFNRKAVLNYNENLEKNRINANFSTGRNVYNTEIVIKNNDIVIMKCDCAKAKSRRNCEHMAALLYEASYVGELLLKNKIIDERPAVKAITKNTKNAEMSAKKSIDEKLNIIDDNKFDNFVQGTLDSLLDTNLAVNEDKNETKDIKMTGASDIKKNYDEVQERIAKRKQEKAEKKAEIKRKKKEAEERERKRREDEAAEKQKIELEAIEREKERLLQLAKEEEENKARIEQERLEKERQKEERRMKKIEEAKARKEDKSNKKEIPKIAGSKNLNLVYDEVLTDANTESDEVSDNFGRRKDEHYVYYKFDKIMKNSYQYSNHKAEKGLKLIKNNQIELQECEVYLNEVNVQICHMTARTSTKKDMTGEINYVNIYFSKDRIHELNCTCNECKRYGYYYYSSNECAYKSAFAELIKTYLAQNSIGDATNPSGHILLSTFHDRRMRKILNDKSDEIVHIEPRLIIKNGECRLSFKIGSKKMYIIKDLIDFVHQVKISGSVEYGVDCTINHSIDCFDKESQKWIAFIKDAIQEEIEIRKRVSEIDWRSAKKKAPDMEMYGWRIDRLFDLLENTEISYENKDSDKKEKGVLRRANNKPNLSLIVSPVNDGGQFMGIALTLNSPRFFKGVQFNYFIENGKLCRVDVDDAGMEYAINMSRYPMPIEIGRYHLSEFYYQILPAIENAVDVIETNPQFVEQYMSPEVKFTFYLDAPDNDITCKVMADYGQKTYSTVQLLKSGDAYAPEDGDKRQLFKEEEVLALLGKYFSGINLKMDYLNCEGNEENIYSFISNGVEQISEYGEVRCTKRFKSMNYLKHASVKVGVRVESGLLDLDITTDNLTSAELLDILAHYNPKQKYYRLKSGEFIDIGDESLQLLIEMMESMHISPKEFVKGKMHLPIYRSLYLDKMLEEYESVYSVRDQMFREIIKNMKSINDADFDLPNSLEGTLRKYQKNGFRFIRTLDANGFGGILADDMGLGKTLQMISVLLSLKEGGENAPALVVSPASLVYNWEDEFQKFAPDLKVALAIGSQDKRKEIIENVNDVDVLVTSYDLLKRDIDMYENKSFSVEVIDEAQYIKNHTTAVAKAVKLISSKTKFALTGTPIENRLSELWSIFDYLMPGFLYGYDTFKKEFETPIVKNQDENAMKRLQKMVTPFILRRLKSDVLKDLPDKLEETRVVSFESEQQKLYDAQIVHMKQMLDKQDDSEFGKNKIQMLAELTRLRQICCDPNLCFDNYKGESAKLESCVELIQSAIDGGHKILLFSQFTSMLEIIEKRLVDEKIEYYKITGETSKEKRLEMVKHFNTNDIPVFLISLKAGGVGLNLTGADVVIHYDPWWNLAVQNQATDRAHRIGQKNKVTVYKMIAKNTIEEKILKLQQMKKDLADSIVNTEGVGISTLSKDDIMELLAL